MPRFVGKNFGEGFIQGFAKVEASVRRRLNDFLDRRRPTRRQRMQESAINQAALREFSRSIPREAQDFVQQAYTAASSKTGRELPKGLGSSDPANLSDVERESVRLLADALTHSLQGALTTLGRQNDDAFRQHALRGALTATQLRGATADTVRDAMHNRLEQEGMTAFVSQDGRRWNLKHYCEMAIRTTANEAQNLAVVNVTLGRGIDLVDVDAQPNCCDKCKPWAGKTFSLTGRTAGFPILTFIPPFHPLCSCFLRASRKAGDYPVFGGPLDRGSLELSSIIAQRQRQQATKVAA